VRVRATRRLIPLLLAASVAALWTLLLAGPTVACQCFTPDTMAEVAGQPRTIVITGIPGPLAARGVPVQVHRWIRGHDPRPVVWLAAWSIGPDERACDGPAPAAGAPLLRVLAMPPDGSDPYGGQCAQVSRLDAADGQQALAEAVDAFGAGLALTDRPTGPPGQQTLVGTRGGAPLAELWAVALAGVAVFGLAALTLVAARRHRA
jgi:hypothetical protein